MSGAEQIGRLLVSKGFTPQSHEISPFAVKAAAGYHTAPAWGRVRRVRRWGCEKAGR